MKIVSLKIYDYYTIPILPIHNAECYTLYHRLNMCCRR